MSIKVAGSLHDEHGKLRGVHILFEAADWAAAQAFVHDSPYASLYTRVEIFELRAEVGAIA